MMTNAAATEAKVCGEVKDITNMVKSKRKIDATEDASSVKKTRLSTEETTPVTENSEPAMETETKTEEKVAEPAAAVPMNETPAQVTA